MLQSNLIHFKKVTEFQDHLDNVDDPEIISWCKDHNRVWVTHDFEARRKHEEAMKAARIYVLWVRGSPQKYATWEFFKMIVRTIDETIRKIQSSHGAIHFRINSKSGNTPTTHWAESPYDRPKFFK